MTSSVVSSAMRLLGLAWPPCVAVPGVGNRGGLPFDGGRTAGSSSRSNLPSGTVIASRYEKTFDGAFRGHVDISSVGRCDFESAAKAGSVLEIET